MSQLLVTLHIGNLLWGSTSSYGTLGHIATRLWSVDIGVNCFLRLSAKITGLNLWFISVFFGVLATNNPTKFVSMSAVLVLSLFFPHPLFVSPLFLFLNYFIFPWWWTFSVSLKSAIIAAIRATGHWCQD